MVITGRTRNALALRGTWVQIPPSPRINKAGNLRKQTIGFCILEKCDYWYLIFQKNVQNSCLFFRKMCYAIIIPEKDGVFMKRNAMQSLINWKNDPERKPLILRGARQVGKTWLMKEFGQTCYANYVYFNFDEEDELKSIFQANKNPHRIIELLSMISGEKSNPVRL